MTISEAASIPAIKGEGWWGIEDQATVDLGEMTFYGTTDSAWFRIESGRVIMKASGVVEINGNVSTLQTDPGLSNTWIVGSGKTLKIKVAEAPELQGCIVVGETTYTGENKYTVTKTSHTFSVWEVLVI